MRQRYCELSRTKGVCAYASDFADVPDFADSCCVAWDDDKYASLRIYRRQLKSSPLGKVVCVKIDDGTAWKMMNPRSEMTIGHFTTRDDACDYASRLGYEVAAWIE